MNILVDWRNKECSTVVKRCLGFVPKIEGRRRARRIKIKFRVGKTMRIIRLLGLERIIKSRAGGRRCGVFSCRVLQSGRTPANERGCNTLISKKYS
jgi:hypothetical protein